jgi:[lysine-biosynthesis-protein LysW]---L-2-aminoadipate ligase
MNIGIVYTIIRKEEKLIIDALEKKGHKVIKIDDKEQLITLSNDDNSEEFGFKIVLMRSLSLQRSLWFAKYFEEKGIKVVNDYETINTCGNKYLTTLKLINNNIPSPKVIMAFDNNSALKAMEKIGFPCVLKPIVGSWGRLISKVNDIDSAQALLDHKKAINSSTHNVSYVQEFIDKGNEDIRTMVIGNEVIGGIKRVSDNWKTNTTLGAIAVKLQMTNELRELSLKTAKAIGAGVLSIDILEQDGKYFVNEVNATTEFRNSLEVYGVDIPEKIVEYLEALNNEEN